MVNGGKSFPFRAAQPAAKNVLCRTRPAQAWAAHCAFSDNLFFHVDFRAEHVYSGPEEASRPYPSVISSYVNFTPVVIGRTLQPFRTNFSSVIKDGRHVRPTFASFSYIILGSHVPGMERQLDLVHDFALFMSSAHATTVFFQGITVGFTGSIPRFLTVVAQTSICGRTCHPIPLRNCLQHQV